MDIYSYIYFIKQVIHIVSTLRSSLLKVLIDSNLI